MRKKGRKNAEEQRRKEEMSGLREKIYTERNEGEAAY